MVVQEDEPIELFAWSDEVQDYVLLYRGTDVQEAKRVRRSFLNRQTRARHKKEAENRGD